MFQRTMDSPDEYAPDPLVPASSMLSLSAVTVYADSGKCLIRIQDLLEFVLTERRWTGYY